MLRIASRARPTMRAAFASRMMATEIPIGAVARIIRMSVAGEPEAIKVDEIVKGMEGDLQKMPGYVKMVRTVCKSEWAYEGAIVFDSLDTFKGYMGSTERETIFTPKLAEISKFATGEVYSGNRVYDEYLP